MELARGGSLKDYLSNAQLRGEHFPIETVIDWARQLLLVAYSQGSSRGRPGSARLAPAFEGARASRENLISSLKRTGTWDRNWASWIWNARRKLLVRALPSTGDWGPDSSAR